MNVGLPLNNANTVCIYLSMYTNGIFDFTPSIALIIGEREDSEDCFAILVEC